MNGTFPFLLSSVALYKTNWKHYTRATVYFNDSAITLLSMLPRWKVGRAHGNTDTFITYTFIAEGLFNWIYILHESHFPLSLFVNLIGSTEIVIWAWQQESKTLISALEKSIQRNELELWAEEWSSLYTKKAIDLNKEIIIKLTHVKMKMYLNCSRCLLKFS